MKARVLIRPKAGILDPQGAAVERALPALGFEGVRDQTSFSAWQYFCWATVALSAASAPSVSLSTSELA